MNNPVLTVEGFSTAFTTGKGKKKERKKEEEEEEKKNWKLDGYAITPQCHPKCFKKSL